MLLENMLVDWARLLTEVGLIMCAALATRIQWASELGSDFFTQLWWQRQFRRSRSFFKPMLDDSVVDNPSVFYPPLPSSLLARLPQRFVVPVGVLGNYLLDGFAASVVGLVLVSQGADRHTALLGALLWVTLPILHPINARLVGLGARTLGPFLHLLWMLAAFHAIEGNLISGSIMMVTGGALMVLSSQMGTQAILLQSLWLSLVYQTPIVLASMFCSLLLALVAGTSDALAMKVSHIRWYSRNGRRFLASRNSWSHFLKCIRRNPAVSLNYFAASTTIGVTALGLVGLVPLVHAIWTAKPETLPQPFVYFCMTATSGALLGSALTLKGPLEIFGESERYLEYVSPFMVIGLILYAGDVVTQETLLLGLVLSLFGVYVNLALSKIDRLRRALSDNHSADEIEQVRSALAPLGPRKIATSPITLASRLSITLNDTAHYRFLHVLVGNRVSRELPWPTEPGVYPYLDTRKDFLNAYGIDTVVIAKSHLKYLPPATGLEQLKNWRRTSTAAYEIYTR